MERVQRQPVPNAINLVMVRSYRDQQRHEVGFKKTSEDPEINDKDWPRTLENIKEYLASQYGVTGATFDYVVPLRLPSNLKLKILMKIMKLWTKK
jgi:hypothetical protein